ncbi:hypothetical protein [Paludibacter sp. 221]|uniref:hypothetical protein n=1 Tax=Paludibacter sp. 221 TaxID=2302939 RepID=UPI0013D8A58E|nr:hypothetical protein [Paludibacter sp. 221]
MKNLITYIKQHFLIVFILNISVIAILYLFVINPYHEIYVLKNKHFIMAHGNNLSLTYRSFSLEFNGNGEDLKYHALKYEMDSIIWREKKDRGEDMVIKDAIVITDNFPIYWVLEDECITYHLKEYYYSTEFHENKFESKLTIDVDLSEHREHTILYRYKGNFFGINEKKFKIEMNYTCFDDTPRGTQGFLIKAPFNFDIETFPPYQQLFDESLVYSESDNDFLDYVYIKGERTDNTSKHETRNLVIATLLGGIISLLFTMFSKYIENYYKRNKLKKLNVKKDMEKEKLREDNNTNINV